MNDIILFPFAQYWWFYVGFVFFVLAVLAVDLGLINKKDHVVSFRESAAWTTFWVGLALVFNVFFYYFALWKFSADPALTAIPGFDPAAQARQSALEFLSGFVVEKSLAVDNIFVFVLVFNYFAVPAIYQHRVLFYGIIGALLFRAIFIAAGAYLMQSHAVILFFGGFLIFTGIRMLFGPSKPVEPEKNIVIRLIRRWIEVTPKIEGHDFFIRKNGVLMATPLFVALVFLEISDLVFAIDSVPAIFALTKEPLIVFTSNIFAILGLRAMFFMLAGLMERFEYLKFGLALILIFVGLKMVWLNDLYGGKFPILLSLGIIGALLGGSVVFSLYKTRQSAS